MIHDWISSSLRIRSKRVCFCVTARRNSCVSPAAAWGTAAFPQLSPEEQRTEEDRGTMVDFCGRWLESAGYYSRLMDTQSQTESSGRLLYGTACLLQPVAQQQHHQQQQQQQHDHQQQEQQLVGPATGCWAAAVSQQQWLPALSQQSVRHSPAAAAGAASRADSWLTDGVTRTDTSPTPTPTPMTPTAASASALTTTPGLAAFWPTDGEF